MHLLRLNHLFQPKLPPKLLVLALATLALPGCFGGTVAQQLARSILMQGADKATAAAMDAHELNDTKAAQYMLPNNTKLDDYQVALLRSGFEPIQAQVEELPQAATQAESSTKLIQESRLVNVEVWNMLIGDEKQQLLETAKLQGSLLIPPREEWPQWYVAVGSTVGNNNGKSSQAITFLIPPDLGKMRTGARALVELPNNTKSGGELSIARYALN
jgi:hypothetical protein